ncbi:MAG: 3-oxoacyl-[acyl-carrier-protein] reductase [Firmicutes bacterium]|nr:3-oxoacyl-[acyl-carrier-protein] reductase [Bacillota bacterium]
MSVELANRVAIVTGASGGIGQAIAREFALAGAAVVLGYGQRALPAETLAQELVGSGHQALACQADVSTASGAAALVKAAVDAFGHLDILVNNAGITRDGLFLRMKEKDWDDVLSTNLKSVYLCVQAASRQLLRSSCGRVINISSVASLMGNLGQANYVAAKAGMNGLTKTLAREFSGRSVTVNAVAPGFVETDMTASLGEMKERILAQIPLGRLGQPQDVAGLCVFLAGDAGSYITGQVIQVDGGLVM